MKTRRLLYLTAQQMAGYRWSSGKLSQEEAFPANEEGCRQFSDYLARNPKTTYTLLLNVSEEGFHIETIPFLQGGDRQTVIKRKLGQTFFNAPLTASLSLGHEKTKRKDERLLLAAMTGTEHLAPWLGALRSSGVALSAIHSLPLLVPALLGKIQFKEERCLFLSVQDQSIRQSYLENGQTHFSRLTPLHHSSIAAVAQAFSTETLKLLQYLTSQRLVARNQPITACILAHSDAIKAIRAQCVDTETLRYLILDIGDCARRIGLRAPPATSHCESLFLSLMAGSPPRIQFADDDLRHSYHLSQWRTALYGLGGFSLSACLLASAFLLYETQTISQETAGLNDETRVARQRYEEIARTFPPIPTSNDTLRQIIDRYADLEKKSASPTGLYLVISRALQGAPAIEIETIDWKTGGADTSAVPTSTPAGLAAKAVPPDSETAILRGTLRLGTNANPRQMLNVFNSFVEALKTTPGIQLDILKRPFDIEPSKALKDEDTTAEDNKPRSYSIQITRKIVP